MAGKLTAEQRDQMRKLPFTVYSPSRGGGRDWADLINAGLVEVTDVGSDEAQETILQVSATDAGRRALEQSAKE